MWPLNRAFLVVDAGSVPGRSVDHDVVASYLDGSRSLSEVASIVGCTKETVRYVAKVRGLPWRNESRQCAPKVDPGLIVETFGRVGTMTGTARRLGVNVMTVRKYLIRAGHWPATPEH